VEPWEAALIAKRVHRLNDTASSEAHSTQRLGGRLASTTFGLGGKLQVRAQFLFEIAIPTPSAQRAEQTMNPFANPHRPLSS